VYVVSVATGDAVNQATVQAALTAQGYTSTRAGKVDTIDTNLDTVLTKTTDIHNKEGLDATDPVVITPTSITTSRLSQTISGDGETSSTVTRDP
jgi:hypothetical protein